MSPLEPIDYECLSKAVDVHGYRESKIACIKTIREFMKPFEMNQFDTSCALIMQFSELLKLSITFIRKGGIYKEFNNYMNSLSKQFNLLFENWIQFIDSMDKKTPIQFGMVKPK